MAPLALSMSVRAASAQAAEGEGAIEGLIVDGAGAPLADALISVRSVLLPDGETELETDAAGAFRLAPLEAGQYDVLVDADGFRRAEWRGLRVEAGQPTRLQVTLQPTAGGY